MYRLWPTRGTGSMWTNGTTSRGTVTILELPAALTLTERWSSFVLLKWMDSGRSASGTRYISIQRAWLHVLTYYILSYIYKCMHGHAIIVIGSGEYVSAVPNTPVFAPSSIPTQNIKCCWVYAYRGTASSRPSSYDRWTRVSFCSIAWSKILTI